MADSISAPSVEEVLAAVQANVVRLEKSLPDLICDEHIVTRRLTGGEKTGGEKATRVEATLTVRRSPASAKSTFVETRKVRSIDGKPSNRAKIPGPFIVAGAPAYAALHSTFNSMETAGCFERRLSGPETYQGKPALILETIPKDDARRVEACTGIASGSSSRAWIDSVSGNVMKIEGRNPHPRGETPAEITWSMEFEPVSFAEEQYWLPVSTTNEWRDLAKGRSFEWVSRYSGYRKFSVSSTVRADDRE